jgi:hypothetical protein
VDKKQVTARWARNLTAEMGKQPNSRDGQETLQQRWARNLTEEIGKKLNS